MKFDQIEALARKAGFESHDILLNHPKQLANFAALVAAQERESCCTLLEGMHETNASGHRHYQYAAQALRQLREQA